MQLFLDTRHLLEKRDSTSITILTSPSNTSAENLIESDTDFVCLTLAMVDFHTVYFRLSEFFDCNGGCGRNGCR